MPAFFSYGMAFTLIILMCLPFNAGAHQREDQNILSNPISFVEKQNPVALTLVAPPSNSNPVSEKTKIKISRAANVRGRPVQFRDQEIDIDQIISGSPVKLNNPQMKCTMCQYLVQKIALYYKAKVDNLPVLLQTKTFTRITEDDDTSDKSAEAEKKPAEAEKKPAEAPKAAEDGGAAGGKNYMDDINAGAAAMVKAFKGDDKETSKASDSKKDDSNKDDSKKEDPPTPPPQQIYIVATPPPPSPFPVATKLSPVIDFDTPDPREYEDDIQGEDEEESEEQIEQEEREEAQRRQKRQHRVRSDLSDAKARRQQKLRYIIGDMPPLEHKKPTTPLEGNLYTKMRPLVKQKLWELCKTKLPGSEIDFCYPLNNKYFSLITKRLDTGNAPLSICEEIRYCTTNVVVLQRDQLPPI